MIAPIDGDAGAQVGMVATPEHMAWLRDTLEVIARKAREAAASLPTRPTTLATSHVRGVEDRRPVTRATALLASMRRREESFGDCADLFGDPCLTMLLDLYVSKAKGRIVCVSSACIASGAPPTTALRWVAKLEECGYAYRRPDPEDRRRYILTITSKACTALEAYLEGA